MVCAGNHDVYPEQEGYVHRFHMPGPVMYEMEDGDYFYTFSAGPGIVNLQVSILCIYCFFIISFCCIYILNKYLLLFIECCSTIHWFLHRVVVLSRKKCNCSPTVFVARKDPENCFEPRK